MKSGVKQDSISKIASPSQLTIVFEVALTSIPPRHTTALIFEILGRYFRPLTCQYRYLEMFSKRREFIS